LEAPRGFYVTISDVTPAAIPDVLAVFNDLSEIPGFGNAETPS